MLRVAYVATFGIFDSKVRSGIFKVYPASDRIFIFDI